jgi:hypothetical protein
VPHTHHDALEFANGTVVPVALLMERQWATVLQLPASEQPAEKAEPTAHEEPVQRELNLSDAR